MTTGPTHGAHGTGPADAQPPQDVEFHQFHALMVEAVAPAERFGHREHVHLTWLAVRRYGVPKAVAVICRGIQQVACYRVASQTYNATLSRAWVELVGHHTRRASGRA